MNTWNGWIVAWRQLGDRLIEWLVALLRKCLSSSEFSIEKGEDENISDEEVIAGQEEEIAVADGVELEQVDYGPQVEQFCEMLRRQGRFLPAWEQIGIRCFLLQLCESGKSIVIHETEEPIAALDWFRWFVESLPPFVPLEELTAEAVPHQFSSATLMPTHSKRIDNRSVTLHRRVLQIMSTEPSLSYAQALSHAAE